MSNNTKARSEFIFNTAASFLEGAGWCVWFDALPAGPERYQALESIYAAVIQATGCVRDTAKRNVAKALRRARYGEMIKRGGRREPPGGAPPGNRNAAKKLDG